MAHAGTPKGARQGAARVRPNLERYAAVDPATFWADARAELAGLPGGGLNIAHEAVDRHLAGPGRDRVALRFIRRDGTREDRTYADLARDTSRFANALRGLGVAPGELVCALAGRIPELYIAALGTVKARSVFSPLFSAFGPEPIRTRLELGARECSSRPRRSTAARWRPLRPSLPLLEHVLLVGDEGGETGDRRHARSAAAPARGERRVRDRADGRRGHRARAFHERHDGRARRPRCTCTARSSPTTSRRSSRSTCIPTTSSGARPIPAGSPAPRTASSRPLTNGVTSIVDEGDFDARRWYETLRDERVSVWYTAPTAIRLLMRAGDELARAYHLPDLRFCASVGEPLNPECVVWGQATPRPRPSTTTGGRPRPAGS